MAALFLCNCEKWYDIPGWDGLYQISNYLRVKSAKRKINWIGGKKRTIPERILKIHYDGHYPKVALWRGNNGVSRRMHMIVADVFLPKDSNKIQINHKNCDKKDFSIENLERVTPRENIAHAHANGLCKPSDNRGEKNPRCKIKHTDVVKIREAADVATVNRRELAKIYGVSYTAISDIINRRSWNN